MFGESDATTGRKDLTKGQKSKVTSDRSGTPEVVGKHVVNKEHVTKENPSPKIGNIKAMWENRSVFKNKPVHSEAAPELEEIRAKLNEAKAIWAAPSSPKPTLNSEKPLRRRMSFENEQKTSTAENEDAEPRKVGSILSLWESIEQDKKSNGHKAIKDESFDLKTVGRLKGAKSMFESMSKQNNSAPVVRQNNRNADEASSKTSSTLVHGVKSLFEKQSRHLEPQKTMASRTNREMSSPTPKSSQLQSRASRYPSASKSQPANAPNLKANDETPIGSRHPRRLRNTEFEVTSRKRDDKNERDNEVEHFSEAAIYDEQAPTTSIKSRIK